MKPDTKQFLICFILVLLTFDISCSRTSTNHADNLATPTVSPTLEPTPVTAVPESMSLSEATNQEGIEVRVQGIDVKTMSVEVSCPYRTTITIPAGTTFISGASDTQNMMAATTTTFVFNEVPQGSLPTVQTSKIEVYCINRFLEAPTGDSNFEVSRYEESDPLVRLSECLSRSGAEHTVRQLAVWAVSDNFVNMTTAGVRAKFLAAVNHKIDKLDQDEIIKHIREKQPNLSDEDVEKIRSEIDIEQFKAELRAEAPQEVEDDIKEYRTKARPLLEGCGWDLSNSSFFNIY